LYRALHPDESSLANENGRCPGTFQVQRPFGLGWIFGCGLV
jgi:hypothetical protein